MTVYYDGNAELARKLLDGYAHELAEKIRDYEWDECGYGDTNCPCDAADLIDPDKGES
ncbi:hypothetical protein [Streptomyces nigrescens]|nr:hypothetical protein [Streptomyces nigrescens]